MSSFIGHSLAGWTAFAITQPSLTDRSNEPSHHLWLWLTWLIVIASIPDIDYLIPALRLQSANQILRITHSLIGAIFVPSCTMLVLWLLGRRGKLFKVQSLQLVLAGLSHLLLDLLTGVFPSPLLYPFSTQTFRLPFGLLPSAGQIQLTNSFLYRNLLIELGVLVPLSTSLVLAVRDFQRSHKGCLSIATGLLVSVCFMIWALTLSR